MKVYYYDKVIIKTNIYRLNVIVLLYVNIVKYLQTPVKSKAS